MIVGSDLRRGAAPRGPLFVLAGAAALALALFMTMGGGAGDEVASADRALAPTVPADVATGPGLDAPDDAGRSSTDATIVTAGGLSIPVGVRLAGGGTLVGTVFDRDGGARVGGVRVDLLTLPPVGKHFFERILGAAKFPERSIRAVLPVATAATAADGSFEFRDVRAGHYFLEARGAHHVADHSAQVRVSAAGDGGPVDVYVRRGGRVLGRVVRGDGSPVSGAKVGVFQGAQSLLTAIKQGELRYEEAYTDADGTFVIPGVAPGTGFEVSAMRSGITLSHELGVEVFAGRDTHVELVVREGARLEGVVFTLEPDDEGGFDRRPLAGAHVGAIPQGLRDNHFLAEVLEETHALTDENGRYVLTNVPPGQIDVGAWAPGHLPSKSPMVHAAPGAGLAVPEIELRTGPMVTVRFVDSLGEPIPGVIASWFVVDFSELEFEISLTPLLMQALEGFVYPESDDDGVLVAGPFPGDAPFGFFGSKPGYEAVTHSWNPDTEGDEIEITLRSGGAIEGIVMDARELAPVEAFTVECAGRLEPDGEAPRGWNPFSGGVLMEDTGGRFRLDRVSPGEFDVTISAPGYVTTTLEDVLVTEGETTRGLIVKLSPGGTVQGRVLDSSGEPVAGAQVIARDSDGEPLRRRGRRLRGIGGRGAKEFGQEIAFGSMEMASALGVEGPGATTSGPDGSFELSGLPDMRIVVTATHRDFSRGRSEEVDVGAGLEDVEVELVLPRGSTLLGTVTDRFDRPIAEAIVVALAPNNFREFDPTITGLYQGSTDAEGEYRIDHMEGGSYFVAVTRGDEALNITSFLGTLNFDLITVPDEGEVRFDVTDSSAAACRVHGTVTHRGEPVSRGGIFALGFESENVLGVDFKIAQVGVDGTYEFEGLAPGGYLFTHGSGNSEISVDVEIPDLPEYRLDIALPEGGVTGRVLDASSGEPVRGAEVRLKRAVDDTFAASGLIGSLISREGRLERDWTGEDGVYEFDGMQDGAYLLSVVPPGWGPHEDRYAPSEPQEVEVAGGVSTEGIDVRLEPSLELRGIVVDEVGDPVRRARVFASPSDDDSLPPSDTRTDGEGRFVLKGLAAGPYVLTGSRKEYADSAPTIVEVEAGRAGDLRIVLERGVEVRVVVVGPDGRAVSGATGRLSRGDGAGVPLEEQARRTFRGILSGGALSGQDGVIELGRFAAGSYRLEVERGDRRATREGVRVETGRTLEITIELP